MYHVRRPLRDRNKLPVVAVGILLYLMTLVRDKRDSYPVALVLKKKRCQASALGHVEKKRRWRRTVNSRRAG